MTINKPLILLTSIMLSSCVHLKTPEENITDLNNGAVALIISGCQFKYKTDNLILPDKEKNSHCNTYWESTSGNKISLLGYSNINFIKPGTYEFTGFSGYINRETSWVYNKNKKSPSIFTSFTVKGGDVVYIGDFLLNTIDSKQVLQSIKPIYYKIEFISKYLGKKYPSLTHKLEVKHTKMKPEFEFVRDYMPSLDE